MRTLGISITFCGGGGWEWRTTTRSEAKKEEKENDASIDALHLRWRQQICRATKRPLSICIGTNVGVERYHFVFVSALTIFYIAHSFFPHYACWVTKGGKRMSIALPFIVVDVNADAKQYQCRWRAMLLYICISADAKRCSTFAFALMQMSSGSSSPHM